MKILLATKLMDVGGIEKSVVILARELRNRGNQVWVISSGGHLVTDLERDGTRHITADLDLTSLPGLIKAATTIRSLVRDEQIDLVHSFSATAAVAVNLALRPRSRTGTPRVRLVTSPMGLQNSPREYPWTTWMRNWLLTVGAERILVISPEIRRYLKQAGAKDEFLVDFNFVGLDPEEFRETPNDRLSVRREFGFPDDTQIISTIGALHPRKSHELFVDAAGLVMRQHPKARFLIVGEGELYADLQQRARAGGLEGMLALTGVRDDVPRLLSATDVYVKPGIVEGFIGITVLEALALGKPVIAFDTEDVKLALSDGITGFVVPNADTRALADKIGYLLRHPEVGERLGEAGRQLVTERFHFGLLAQRLEQFYQEMLNGPRTPALAH